MLSADPFEELQQVVLADPEARTQRLFDAVGALQQVARPEKWLVCQVRPIDQGVVLIAWNHGHRPILAQISDPSLTRAGQRQPALGLAADMARQAK
ncbi:hypothetical protein GCM10028790_19690 [Micromonospora taraxaci]